VNSGIVYFTAYDNLWAVNASSGSLVWTSYNDDYSPDASPTVVNGMVLDPAVDGGGTIHSYNAQTGAALTPYNGGIGKGNPCESNGVVYVADETVPVAAWNLYTAAPKFYGPGYGVGTSPTVYGGAVYTGGTAGLIAADTGTGALLWQETTFQTCAPAAGGGSVFVCTNGSTLNAYNASTGALQWSIGLNVYTSQNITVSNAIVYVGTGGGVVAVAGSSGKILWNFQINATVLSGPLVIDWTGTVHHTTASGDQQ
jgi:outer membrane protein assembly factor BamB